MRIELLSLFKSLVKIFVISLLLFLSSKDLAIAAIILSQTDNNAQGKHLATQNFSPTTVAGLTGKVSAITIKTGWITDPGHGRCTIELRLNGANRYPGFVSTNHFDMSLGVTDKRFTFDTSLSPSIENISSIAWFVYAPDPGNCTGTYDNHEDGASNLQTPPWDAVNTKMLSNTVSGIDMYLIIEDDQPGVEAKTPVLIVPGVMGTEITDENEIFWLNIPRSLQDIGDDYLDNLLLKDNFTPINSALSKGEILKKPNPLFDYSEGLINELRGQGYTEDEDLFTFPYDWRYGVTTPDLNGLSNVDYLKNKIQDILEKTQSSKVNVVAHSTGGLLVKKLVEDNPSTHGINKAIMVGVPHLGAPKATKVFFQGDSFGVPGLNPDELKKLAKNLPVVYDLAPSQEYYTKAGSWMKNIDASDGINISNLSPLEVRTFMSVDGVLNDLAWQNAQNLHQANFDDLDLRNFGIDAYSIVGCQAETPGKVVRYENHSTFSDGVYYHEPEITVGDGTVPFVSADAMPTDEDKSFFVRKADHGKMLSTDGSRQKIVNILTGNGLPTNNVISKTELEQDPTLCGLFGKKIEFQSPVNLKVTDQDGNILETFDDKNFTNSILGASLDIIDGHKFVFLPTGDGETYNFEFWGTADGTFTLNIKNVINGQINQISHYIDVPITPSSIGNINVDSGETALKINGEEETILEPTTIETPVLSPDAFAPITSASTTGTQGQTGYFRSSVGVELNAIDPEVEGIDNSGIYKTEVKINSNPGQNYINTLSFNNEGQTKLSYYSTDNAGNREILQNLQFTIDKTNPTITSNNDGKTYLKGTQVNPDYECLDELSGIYSCRIDANEYLDTTEPGIHEYTVHAEDRAGNTTEKNITYSVLEILDLNTFEKEVKISGKGTTLPVKFKLLGNANSYIKDTEAQLFVGKELRPATSSGSSNTGNLFRYDEANNQYIYNLSVTSENYTSGKSYALTIVLPGIGYYVIPNLLTVQ